MLKRKGIKRLVPKIEWSMLYLRKELKSGRGQNWAKTRTAREKRATTFSSVCVGVAVWVCLRGRGGKCVGGAALIAAVVCVCVACACVCVIVWLWRSECNCGCVSMIAWARKGECGWGSLDCCSQVCVCVGGIEAEGGSKCGCVGVGVIVWGSDCMGKEGCV